MMREEEIGRLREEAERRKERLLQLKQKAAGRNNDDGQGAAPLPSPIFRSYRPSDPSLKEAVLPAVKPAEIAEEVEDQLEAGKQKHVVEQVDLTSLAPRKPDWDLKRDVAKKLDILDRRTQRAIAELIRDRLEAQEEEDADERAEVDLNAAVSAGARAEMLRDDDDDDEDDES